MLDSLLQQLGLTDKEITVYLAILKNGKISPAQIAKITTVNRTTVYSATAELLKRGIISEDLGTKTQYLIALPPQELMQLAHKEEQMLEKKKETIRSAISELEKVTQNIKYSIPKLSFIAEEDIDQFLRRRTPIWNVSAKKVGSLAFWGFQDPTLLNDYESWVNWYWQQPSSKGMVGNIITRPSEHEDRFSPKSYPGRQSRYWEGAEGYTATTWVVGEFIIMISTAQHPHYLVEIHDAILAENMRTTFKGIWQSLS